MPPSWAGCSVTEDCMHILHWIYIGLAVYCLALLVVELFQEKRWREQVALMMILIPFVLRILHIK